MMVAVFSLYSREPVATTVPAKGSSRSLKEMVPSRSLIPQRVTIWRAMAVTCCRSFSAPVVMCPMATCSAARPTQGRHQPRLQVLLGVVVAIIQWRILCYPKRLAPRHDRHLGDWINILLQ